MSPPPGIPAAGLAAKALCGFFVLRSRTVVGLSRTDLELHALVEEEVAVVPELLRQEWLQLLDVVEGDHVPLLEAGDRRPGVLGGAGRCLHQAHDRDGEDHSACHGSTSSRTFGIVGVIM